MEEPWRGAGLRAVELLPWRPEGRRRGGVTGTLKESAALKGAATFSGGSSQASILDLSFVGREPRHELSDLSACLPPPSCDLMSAAPLAVNRTQVVPIDGVLSGQPLGREQSGEQWGRSGGRRQDRFVSEQIGGWRPFPWGGKTGSRTRAGKGQEASILLSPWTGVWEPPTESPRALSFHL